MSTQTRSEYMALPYDPALSDSRHRAYYAQLVTTGTISRVVMSIGADKLRASKDAKNLNDIPLALWDRFAGRLPMRSFTELGDFCTLGGTVCVAKEAARQWLESQAARERAV